MEVYSVSAGKPEVVIGIYVRQLSWNVLSFMYNFKKMSLATGDNAPEVMDTKEPEVFYM